jgi:trehalose 6-phosphate synthase
MVAMRQTIRVALLLMLSVAGLAWLVDRAVARTTQRWFEDDAQLRARLAVSAARQPMTSYWRSGDRAALRTLLEQMASDQHVVGVAACAPDRTLVTYSSGYPAPLLGCSWMDAPGVESTKGGAVSRESDISLGTLELHASQIAITDAAGTLGYVALLHDLAYMSARRQQMRSYLISATIVLMGIGALLLLVSTRLTRRRWTAELRGLLLRPAERRKSEFQPIMKDIRELAERIASEREQPNAEAGWNAPRLRDILNHDLRGEQVVVVANREPYMHERRNGQIEVVHPASGLVSALEPVVRACGGVWIAHGSGSADRETADKRGRLRVPPGEDSYTLRRIWLT